MKEKQTDAWFRRLWAYLHENVEDFGVIFSTFVLLVLMLLTFYLINPRFLGPIAIRSVSIRASYYLVAAVGMTIVMAVGGIDISVGSIVGVCAVTLGLTLVAWQLPLWVGLLACVVVGGLLGTFNGFVISKVRVPPIVVTLGTLTLFRGIAHLMTGGTMFYSFPPAFHWFGGGNIFGTFPVPVFLALLVVIWGHIFLKWTRTGRQIAAVGGNEEAAKMAGLPVDRRRWLPYTIAGILMGVATILMVSRIGAAQAIMGEVWEIYIITATVLGGTSVFGGKGVIWGAVLGAFILGALEIGLVMARVADFWQLAAVGFLFVVVVTIRTLTGEERAK